MIYAAYVIICILVFVFGSVIGSFLNVLIYRLPRGLNPAKGFSFCPSCEHRLGPADLVPIFSYLFLRGRCRYCGARISPRYAIVEFMGGAAAVLLYLFIPLPAAAIYFGVFCALLYASFIDAEFMELPDTAHLVIVVCAILSYFLLDGPGLVSRLIGFACISLPMFIIALIKEGAFGFGDVKLMAASGLLLGWRCNLLAAFIGIILGGVYAVILVIRKTKGKEEHFAFGPFLAVGIMTSLIAGDEIIDLYFGLYS